MGGSGRRLAGAALTAELGRPADELVEHPGGAVTEERPLERLPIDQPASSDEHRTGGLVYYDGANMKITNVPDSDSLLKRAYRAGWALS